MHDAALIVVPAELQSVGACVVHGALYKVHTTHILIPHGPCSGIESNGLGSVSLQRGK